MKQDSVQSQPRLQPNSRMCFVCGLENPVGLHLRIYRTRPGEIEAAFTAPEAFQGYPGVLHGGIAASILDEICGRVHMGDDPASPRFLFTAKLEVKYRRNIPVGVPLRIVGKAAKSKGRLAEGWAGIYAAGSDELLAEAKAVLIEVPTDAVERTNLEDLGWKVYPE